MSLGRNKTPGMEPVDSSSAVNLPCVVPYVTKCACMYPPNFRKWMDRRESFFMMNIAFYTKVSE